MKKMQNRERGFTLSEVIITLVVIGIVAAITVPMLSNSASDKKWNVARQKAQATIGEAFRLMTVNGEIDKTLSTQQFVEKVIPKYLKLAKTCTVAKATECGMSTASNFYKTPNGVKVTLPTTWQNSTKAEIVTNTPPAGTFATVAVYNHNNPNTNSSFMFQTLDGFSVNFFYNPYCAAGLKDKYNYRYNSDGYHSDGAYLQSSMDTICMMGVYDMNGKSGPNRVGYDVGFVGSFYNGFETKTATASPDSSGKHKFNDIKPVNNNYMNGAVNYCKNLDKDNNWTMPDIYQVRLLYLNQKMVRNTTSEDIYFVAKSIDPIASFCQQRVLFNSGGSDVFCTGGGKTTVQESYIQCVRANTLK